MAISTDEGAGVQRPLATVAIGGWLLATYHYLYFITCNVHLVWRHISLKNDRKLHEIEDTEDGYQL